MASSTRAGAPVRRPPAAPGADVGVRLAAQSREGAVRERFVRDLLARVPLAQVAEAYLFAPMRQGGIESGVAVIAARPAVADVPDEDTPTVDEPGDPSAEALDAPTDTRPANPLRPARHTVYTASYRLTVRGPDRGRWQVEVRAEGDAPLVTLGAVVEGVRRRAGDASPPSRLDADALARLAHHDGGAA